MDEQTAQNLKSTPFQKRLEEKNGRFFARKDSQDSCTFLSAEQRCQLHSELGAQAKPQGCRQFPFRLTRTPDGIFVGTSFTCPSIQQNQGEPLGQFRDELEPMATTLPLWGAEGLTVWRETRLAWSDYRMLEDFLLQREVVEAGLGQGLWALAQWSLNPELPLRGYLERGAAALEPPDEPLMLMEHHWFSKLLEHCQEKPALRREAPAAPLDRYLRALLHGKMLVNRRPLLGNLALLYLVPRLYRHWFAISGSLDHTLDQCERKIATHPNNLDDLVAQMADDFRDQLDAVVF